MKRKAFTLIELISVVFIIAIISSVAIISISTVRQSTKDKQTLNNVTELQLSLESYRSIYGEYPDNLSSLNLSGVDLEGLSYRKNFLDDYEILFELQNYNAGDNLFLGKNCVSSNSYCYNSLYTTDEINTLINENAYIPISTPSEFLNIALSSSNLMGAGTIWEAYYTTGLNKKYLQLYNLDFSTYTELSPIGNASFPFSGIYDGSGLAIKNISLNLPSNAYAGLFGASTGATFRNMIIENINVVGSERAGVFANIDNVLVENVHSINPVVVGGRWAGGLIGRSLNSIIQDSSVLNADIFLEDAAYTWSGVGTFCGEAVTSSIIRRSFATGQVEMSDNIRNLRRTGGLVGIIYGGTLIENSWSSASVLGSGGGSSDSGIGGLLGQLHHSGGGIVRNSYSFGSVSRKAGATAPVGGLIGRNSAGTSGIVTNSYYDKDSSGMIDTGRGFPRTEVQMKQGFASSNIEGEDMYLAWDDNIWSFTPLDAYPQLK